MLSSTTKLSSMVGYEVLCLSVSLLQPLSFFPLVHFSLSPPTPPSLLPPCHYLLCESSCMFLVCLSSYCTFLLVICSLFCCYEPYLTSSREMLNSVVHLCMR